MPSIKSILAILALGAALAVGGCADKNSNVVFSPESGHSSDWLTGHKEAGKADRESCFECHGEELDGGISKVSCTRCHLGGSDSIHPAQWGSYGYARHSAYVAASGSTSCASAACHGTDLRGAGKAPSCTGCHAQSGTSFAKHPAAWPSIKDHGLFLNLSSSKTTQKIATCSTAKCHGSDFKGVFLSGPSCVGCHVADSTGKFVKHPATWTSALVSHKTVTKAGYTSCGTSACHGKEMTGGAYGGVSCYKCHMFKNADGAFVKHPEAWGAAPLYANHSVYKNAHATAICSNAACHPAGSIIAVAACNMCHQNLTAK